MTDLIKIAVDAMGGDNSPNKTIDGIIHEKTTKLLTSKIFVNNQENKETTLKIKDALKDNKSEKY